MTTFIPDPSLVHPNAEFRFILNEIDGIREWMAQEARSDSAFHREYFDELLAWYFTTPKPKHKKNREKALAHAFLIANGGDPVGKAIIEKWQVKASTISKEKHERIDELAAKLDELAPSADLAIERTPEQWTIYRWHYAGTYRSQGYGADKYMQNAIESDKDHLRQYIDEADMKVEDAPGGKNVLVCYSKVGVQILQRRPLPNMRTIVKNMLKRGSNPRVYYPFLPHGYEAKVGLDYFGNDLPGWQDARA